MNKQTNKPSVDWDHVRCPLWICALFSHLCLSCYQHLYIIPGHLSCIENDLVHSFSSTPEALADVCARPDCYGFQQLGDAQTDSVGMGNTWCDLTPKAMCGKPPHTIHTAEVRNLTISLHGKVQYAYHARSDAKYRSWQMHPTWCITKDRWDFGKHARATISITFFGGKAITPSPGRNVSSWCWYTSWNLCI